MYKIFKNNRTAGNTLFNSYEAARQNLRKRLRKLTSLRLNGQPALWFKDLGYTIKAV